MKDVILNIEEKAGGAGRGFALFELGFRPFFFGASLFAVLVTGVWLAVYLGGAAEFLAYRAGNLWHGHEMVFGYAAAVVGGFLLTAVRNWTGIQTLRGAPLALLFLLWVAARVLALFPAPLAAALADLAFLPLLAAAIFVPLAKGRNWGNMLIVAMLLLLAAADALFQLDLLGITSGTAETGLFLGVYLVIGLIMLMGGRVIPFFIERGVSVEVHLKSWRAIEAAGVILLVLFIAVETIVPHRLAGGALAAALAVVQGVRLWGWYTPAIWRVPLLWVLYLGYGWLVAGFALTALAAFTALSPFLALHAFAYGAIGMMTVGMMARVTLGHTGRSIHHVPKGLPAVFALLAVGGAVRVFAPLLWSGFYLQWIVLAGALWMAAFAVFLYLYTPFLLRPRIDGRPG